MNQALTSAFENFEAARLRLRTEIIRRYPLGTKVSFFIQHGQTTPSTGTVAGYPDDTSQGVVLSVLHDQAKSRSRYRYRRVIVKDVLSFARPS